MGLEAQEWIEIWAPFFGKLIENSVLQLSFWVVSKNKIICTPNPKILIFQHFFCFLQKYKKISIDRNSK